MVVGLIQLAHKMSRALSPVLSHVPLASCAILCYALLSTSCSLSLFSLLSLSPSVCVFSVTNVARPKSRFYERIAFFCLLLPPLAPPRPAHHCFVYYVFVSFLHTYFFFLSAPLLLSLVAPLSWQQPEEEEGKELK